MLCGGAGDRFPAVHMAVTKADFDSRGVTNVSTVDGRCHPGHPRPLQTPTDHSAAFATYYGSYHGAYRPPFCHATRPGVRHGQADGCDAWCEAPRFKWALELISWAPLVFTRRGFCVGEFDSRRIAMVVLFYDNE